MKRQLLAFAALALLATSCGTENRETAVAERETQTEATDTTMATEIDNTTVEIEGASAEVDSLLNEI